MDLNVAQRMFGTCENCFKWSRFKVFIRCLQRRNILMTFCSTGCAEDYAPHWRHVLTFNR